MPASIFFFFFVNHTETLVSVETVGDYMGMGEWCLSSVWHCVELERVISRISSPTLYKWQGRAVVWNPAHNFCITQCDTLRVSASANNNRY